KASESEASRERENSVSKCFGS
ncbi:MAG: hypothetical protein RL136_2556, partial [Planctomycetota bacterium]